MTKKDITKSIIKFIKNKLEFDTTNIKNIEDQDIFDMGLDCLDKIEIEIMCEVKYQMRIPSEDLDNINTISGISDYILNKWNSKNVQNSH